MHHDQSNKNLKIAIAGASGFVGQALVDSLAPKAEVIGLSRSRSGESLVSGTHRVLWRQCDLFSQLQLEKALDDVDVAIYLVHSMLPSAALVQARFEDLDLVLADNFGQAARKCGVKHIIYLSGILPDVGSDEWSEHLRSRFEVEQVLRASGIPVSVCRSGIILGPGGSSLEILKRLIVRLPVLICPRWTQSLSSPVSLGRVIQSLEYLALGPKDDSRVYDLCESYSLSYLEMMKETARILGLKRLFVSVNIFRPKLSRFWVRMVTGAPKDLVYPLVMSLGHDILPSKNNLLLDFRMDHHFSDLLKVSLLGGRMPHAFKSGSRERFTVRSVQRLCVGAEVTAPEIAHEYMNWLGHFFSPFIRVVVKNNVIGFYFLFMKRALLILSFSESRSDEHRVLFYTRGGLLARRRGRGRLEFRILSGMGIVLAAIHDFHPRLHWQIYRFTQALVHLWVMKSFGRHLANIATKPKAV